MPASAHGKNHSAATMVPGYALAVAAGSTLIVGGTVTFDATGAEPHGAADAPGGLSIRIQVSNSDGAIVWATAGYASRSFSLGAAGHATASLYTLDNATETEYATTEFDIA